MPRESHVEKRRRCQRGGTLYLTLIVVILSGITLGVVIPLGVPWFVGKTGNLGHGRTKKLQKSFGARPQ